MPKRQLGNKQIYHKKNGFTSDQRTSPARVNKVVIIIIIIIINTLTCMLENVSNISITKTMSVNKCLRYSSET